ncbi:hypothetical protein ON010_g1929 [Phytophthora cinnamomi]|nr:hypothetical protein ON010_g1929 [Phytophthora cinnamomi]
MLATASRVDRVHGEQQPRRHGPHKGPSLSPNCSLRLPIGGCGGRVLRVLVASVHRQAPLVLLEQLVRHCPHEHRARGVHQGVGAVVEPGAVSASQQEVEAEAQHRERAVALVAARRADVRAPEVVREDVAQPAALRVLVGQHGGAVVPHQAVAVGGPGGQQRRQEDQQRRRLARRTSSSIQEIF